MDCGAGADILQALQSLSSNMATRVTVEYGGGPIQ